MTKIDVTVCAKCNSVKQHGRFVRLTPYEMQVIETHKDHFKFLEDTCNQCLNGIELIKKEV